MIIEKLKKKDILQASEIARNNFKGLRNNAFYWISCNFQAFPRMRYFAAKEKDLILGYILWVEKGGFRKEAVFELEQIAVQEKYRKRGIATSLIQESLKEIKKELSERGSFLKLIEITTGKQNKAQRLYQKALNAKAEAVLANFFREDEVIMLARQNPL